MNWFMRLESKSVMAGLRVAALGAAFCAAAGLAQAATSLRDVLSPEEFRRAGLDKLTADELAFLSGRLLNGTVASPASAAPTTRGMAQPPAELPALSGVAAFGREQEIQQRAVKQAGLPKELQSRIIGRFDGWSGRTLFTLENGQVWQQTEPGEFVVSLDSPVVVIHRGAFGVYYFRVAGYGTQVKVKRLK